MRDSRRAGLGWVAVSVLAAGTLVATAASPASAALLGSQSTGPAATTPTAKPTVELVDGVIRGNLHVSGAGSRPRLQFLSGSKGGKLSLGTVPTGSPTTDAQSFTVLPYADWLDGAAARGLETFVVRVTPTVGKPLDVTIPVHVDQLAPGATPVAYTHMVPGYAGTNISINFFPASGLVEGATAPLILQGSGVGAPGNTNPYQRWDAQARMAGTAAFRAATLGGYNVITWDQRGEFASGGTYQLNDPFLDGIDVENVITWATNYTPTTLNGAGDPAVGMVGGSAGGEMALLVGGIDPRMDAIVPSNTWNSLITSLQPNGALDLSATSTLLSSLTKPQVRLNPQLGAGLKSGIATGRLTDGTLTMLANKNVSTLLGQLQAPALLWQSANDPLFPLAQSIDSAQKILSNPYGVPVKIGWLNGAAPDDSVQQTVSQYTVAWVDKYVKGLPIPDAFTPNFQWWDQAGVRSTSATYPFDPGFNGPDPFVGTSPGGTVASAASCERPVTGISVKVTVPAGAQVVGLPVASLTYVGTGKAQGLCVRVVDAKTAKSLSTTSLLPLTLDKKRRTVACPLNGIAFTGQTGSQLTVTLWVAAQPGSKPDSVRMSASDVLVAFPQRAPQ